MENKTITKEDFCKLYNDMNGEVKVDPEDLATPERAPMDEKDKLPEYKNCDCKSVDVALKENGESVDNGPIAVLSMATLIRWIGDGRYCANQKLSAKDLAAAGLMADGVRYIIVHDDAKYPYSLTISDTRECKIWYSMNEDESSALVLENAGMFFFSRPFENEAEKLKKEYDLKKITKEMLDGANQPVDDRSVEPLQPLSQSDVESDVSGHEENTEKSDSSEEVNVPEEVADHECVDENFVVDFATADEEKDTIIDVIAIKGIDARVYNTGSGPFSTSKTDDWLDPIFVREGKEKGKETKLEVLKNFALICPDKEGKFVLNRFIRSDSEIKELIGAMRHPSEDSDCKWQKLIIANNETLFIGASVTMLVFLDHELVLEERFVEILKENNVNVKIISLGASNNAVQNADQDWIAGWCSNTSYAIGKKVIEILG